MFALHHFASSVMKAYMPPNPLNTLIMQDVRTHYLRRISVGEELRRLLKAGSVETYVEQALGISASDGNYSASEHGLGDRILLGRTSQPIFALGSRLADCLTATAMLDSIYAASIPWLKVSVGSEMAMMLKPSTFWVGFVSLALERAFQR